MWNLTKGNRTLINFCGMENHQKLSNCLSLNSIAEIENLFTHLFAQVEAQIYRGNRVRKSFSLAFFIFPPRANRHNEIMSTHDDVKDQTTDRKSNR